MAVEQLKITEGGQSRTVAVPVEMPEGVSYEGVFGGRPMPAAGAVMSRRSLGMANSIRLYSASAAPMAERKKALKNLPDDKLAELTKNQPQQAIQIKLAKELQGLAEKVAKDGKDGTLTVGRIKVVAGKVEVRVQVTSLTDEVIKKLTELGFTELARAKSVKLLIGTIDVNKLEALAKLTEVRRIEPT